MYVKTLISNIENSCKVQCHMAVTVEVKYLRSHYHLMNRKVRGLWTQSSQQELGCPEEASQGPQHKTVPPVAPRNVLLH